jgi:hypothetical protein
MKNPPKPHFEELMDESSKKLDYALQISAKFVKTRCQLSDFYIPRDGWKHDKVKEVVSKLSDLSFFKRFNKELLEQFMK